MQMDTKVAKRALKTGVFERGCTMLETAGEVNGDPGGTEDSDLLGR
jgi:hypothetical protein